MDQIKRPYNEPKRAKNIWNRANIRVFGPKIPAFKEKFSKHNWGVKILSWQISVYFRMLRLAVNNQI